LRVKIKLWEFLCRGSFNHGTHNGIANTALAVGFEYGHATEVAIWQQAPGANRSIVGIIGQPVNTFWV
jgi:hypothetical protein